MVLNTGLGGKAILYDLKGVKIQEADLIKGVGILNPQGNLSEGVYVVRVIDNAGNSATSRVIIQK